MDAKQSRLVREAKSVSGVALYKLNREIFTLSTDWIALFALILAAVA